MATVFETRDSDVTTGLFEADCTRCPARFTATDKQTIHNYMARHATSHDTEDATRELEQYEKDNPSD